MDWFFKRVFPVFFATIFATIMIMMVIGGMLAVECYRSGDPSSMACYMMSDRHEVGIRHH